MAAARLVEGGETLELIGRLNALVASPRRTTPQVEQARTAG